MNLRDGPQRIRLLIFFLLLLLRSVPAWGQEEEPDDQGVMDSWDRVEEIVIVSEGAGILAEAREDSAIGFSQEDLRIEGIRDIRDLSAFTPNLEIKTAFASVNPTLFIRGVGLDDFNANSASAVSVYQDGFYMNSPAGQLFGLFDVAGVEVLRGPQPILTNASAGAILVASRTPSDSWEAYLVSNFGNYGAKEFEGALNVPIISEQLAFRGAFKLSKRDGITSNRCPGAIRYGRSLDLPYDDQNLAMGQCRFADGVTITGFPPPPSDRWREDVNNTNNWAGRALLSWTPPLPGGQEMEWLLGVSGGQNDSLATQYQHVGMRQVQNYGPPDPVTGARTYTTQYYPTLQNGEPAFDAFTYRQGPTRDDNYAGEYDRIGPEELDLLGGWLKGRWSPSESLEFESLSGYFWHDRHTYENTDGNPKNWLNNNYSDTSWQFTQELEMRWLWADENEIGLGGYYLTEALESLNAFRDNRNLNASAFTQIYSQDTTQWALFGSAHVRLPAMPGWGEFIENFSFDTHFRYNWAKKHMANTTIYSLGGASTQSNAGQDTGSWDAWSADFALAYEFTEEKSVYLKWSRGWKPGTFNANTFRSTYTVSPVKPETVDSIELGLRLNWFDGLLRTDLTGFHYDYENLQVFQLTVDADGFILRRLINSDEASIWGIEWELAAEPIERLVLAFNGGYLSSRYENFKSSFERKRFVQGEGLKIEETTADYSGNRLVASPEWSWTGSVEYGFLLKGGKYGTLIPRFSFSYRDNVFFDPNEGCGAENNISDCLLMQPAYWLLNASLIYRSPDDLFEVVGYVRNIADQEYKVQSFDLTEQQNLLIDVYGDPRTYGVLVTFRYE